MIIAIVPTQHNCPPEHNRTHPDLARLCNNLTSQRYLYDLISDQVCQSFPLRIRDSASDEYFGGCRCIRHTQGSLELLLRFSAIGANQLVY